MGTNAAGLIASPYTAIQNAKPDDSPLKTTAKAAAGMGKSFGKFSGHMFKGMIIDLPFAATEGLRAVPKLYGEEVQSHGEVTDAVSGFSVAGKSFAHGMTDGISGLFMKPAQGVKEEGALGLAKGIGKGTVGFASKACSATVGIVAYPSQGIYKSVRGLVSSGTGKRIATQRHVEGYFLAERESSKELTDFVVARFEGLKRSRTK